MSLNKYIKSRTVRDYYDSINYEISPIVAFWVILNNTYKYAADMHRELRDLKKCTEDISLDELSLGIDVAPTLHSLINHYINLFDDAYQTFKAEGEGVSYRIYDRTVFDDLDSGFLGSYFTYEECIKQIHIRTSNLKNVSYKNILKWDTEEFVIRKSLPEKYDYMTLHITKDKKIIDICEYEKSGIRDFIHNLEELNFEYPLPFEYGDIVRLYRDDGWLNNMVYDGKQYSDNGYTDPFVSCTVVTHESEIFTYLDVNPFELEKCDLGEKDIMSFTHSISSFVKREKRLEEFIKDYSDYIKECKNFLYLNQINADWRTIKKYK